MSQFKNVNEGNATVMPQKGGTGEGGELDGEKERKDNWKEAQSSRLSSLSQFQAFRWWRHTFLESPVNVSGLKSNFQ